MEQWLLLSWGVDRGAVLLWHGHFQVLLPEERAGGNRGYLQVSLVTHKILNTEQLIGRWDMLYIDVRCGGGAVAVQCGKASRNCTVHRLLWRDNPRRA